MNTTRSPDDTLPMCPQLSILALPSTPDWDSAASLCWTCTVLCCCFPLCYPCYLSRTVRKRNKRVKTQPVHNSQARKRNERGQDDYRRSEPLKTDQGRVTSTMTSEQSTGTSGYGTLLSRKGTLHSVLPNVDPNQIQEAILKKVDNSRKDINAVFISTEAATKFLSDCQLSELFQGQGVSLKETKRANVDDIFDDSKEAPGEMNCYDNDSMQFDFSFNSTYNFSRSRLLLEEDSSGVHEILPRKSNSKKLINCGKCSFSFDNDLDSEEEYKVFETFGHVDVAESNFSARVLVTAEANSKKFHCVDPVLLATAYCRQLAMSDLLVIIVRQEDRSEVRRRGLMSYISKYWSGFFPAILVEVGPQDKEWDSFIDKVFCSIQRLRVQDTDEVGGQVFSAVARMFGKMGIGGLNNVL